MSKKVAVILSGCGVFDGAEIHESVLTLLALDRANAEVTCAAPEGNQLHVVDHSTQQPAEGQTRNIMQEAARISRGPITPVSQLSVSDFDAVVLPGGFGAAKNISNFAVAGTDARIDETTATFLTAFQAAGKPIGFACIAPAIAAQLFGDKGLKFTIGNDADTAQALQTWGGQHINCPVDDVVVDENLKIVTTPAYMLATRVTEAEAGLNKMVSAVLALA